MHSLVETLINKTYRLVLITRNWLMSVWLIMFQNLSSLVVFLPSVDLNHCQQQGRKVGRWKSIWHGVLLLQNEKKA